MRIDVLNSGSDGNGYILYAGEDILLMECGVQAKQMLKAIHFEVNRVNACTLSHNHSDHSRFVKEYARYGFPIYMSKESSAGNDIVTAIDRMKRTRAGHFTIIPFFVPHNETECDGFIIEHPSIGKLLFITDAEMCPYDMSQMGINHLMVECNYSREYIMLDVNSSHVMQGHMELQTTKRFIKSVYSENLQSIGLIHLSKKNADPIAFRQEIETEFPGIVVWVAEKGTSLILSKE